MTTEQPRRQELQAQPVPAPGVEAVSEREFKQFLSDVLTAAGLVTHGKKCKDLGRRLGEMSMRLLTAPKTAAAPSGPVPLLARALAEWHEEDGYAAWWATTNCGWASEPAWIGTPLSSDWPGYHTHWTPHPEIPCDPGITAAPNGGKHVEP